MLQSMRQLAHSWYFKGLMLLLVVSFGIWNIGDIFRGNPLHRIVATAGSASFTVQDVNREFEQALARARQSFSPDLTAQQARQLGLVNHTVNDLIENSLIDQDLKRLGIEADNRTALQEVMQYPQFKDKDGKFDKKLLQNALAQQHLSEREFLEQRRQNIASLQLAEAMASLPPIPESAVKDLYKARGQKSVFEVVTVDNAGMHSVDAPDDAVLRSYYQQNQKPFMAPETRGMTIAILSTDSIAKDIAISDDQVKREYESKRDQLAEPEKRDLLQVILQDEAKAKEVAKSAQESGNLVGAAKPTGREIIPLNQSEEANLLPEIAKSVFKLSQGGVSEPIKTGLGWHVLQVKKITPAGTPKYEDIKEKLRENMRRDQAGDQASRLVNQLDDELAAGHALEDMANAMKLRLIKIPAVDADGKMPDGKDPAELPHKEDVLKAAFAQNNGESSPVMDDKNGTYFVVRTDQVTPSALKPFEQVKSDVLAAWKEKEQTKLAEAEAESIAAALRTGKPASSFASQKGVTVRTSQPISILVNNEPLLPKKMLPKIMKLKKGEVAVLPQADKQLVVRLAQVIPAGDAKDVDAEGKIVYEINDAMPKELADEYIGYLRVLFPVRIHQDALDSIAQQGS